MAGHKLERRRPSFKPWNPRASLPCSMVYVGLITDTCHSGEETEAGGGRGVKHSAVPELHHSVLSSKCLLA